LDPWERRPFPPLDLRAVDLVSIHWLVLDLFGPYSVLFLCVQVRERWASSARLTVPVRAGSQQQAEALVGRRARKPRSAAATRAAGQPEGSQRTAHGGTAALQELAMRGKFSIKFFFVLCCVRWMFV